MRAFLSRCIGLVAVVLAISAGAAVLWPDSRARAQDDDPALVRTREQIKMLDSLYKNAVVAVTDIYRDGPPAIRVGKRVFEAMEKDGWHSVRLVDATGAPLNEANVAETEFEKRATEKMQAGMTYYEEISGSGNDRRLLVATVVPAVHRRCASCHGVDEGTLLGFLRYDVLIK